MATSGNQIRQTFEAGADLSTKANTFVIVTNASKFAVTGNKMSDKKYYRHSGYPGGLKTRTLEEMLEKKPTEVIRKAVERMLPKNKLGSQMIERLKVYEGTEHTHAAQKPERIEL